MMSLLYTTGLHALLLWVEPYNRDRQCSTQGWKAFSPSVHKVMQDPEKCNLTKNGSQLLKLFIEYHSDILDKEMNAKESPVFKINASSECVPQLKEEGMSFLEKKQSARTQTAKNLTETPSLKSQAQEIIENRQVNTVNTDKEKVNKGSEKATSDQRSGINGEQICLDMEVIEELSRSEDVADNLLGALSSDDDDDAPYQESDSDESFHLTESLDEKSPSPPPAPRKNRRGRPKKSDGATLKVIGRKVMPGDIVCPCMQPQSGRPLTMCPKCRTWWHDICAGVDWSKHNPQRWLCQKCIQRIQGSEENPEATVSNEVDAEAEFDQDSSQGRLYLDDQEFSEESGKKMMKRPCNPENWTKTIRKKLRTTGQEYVTSKGKKVPARQIGPDCNCKRKCYHNVDEESRKELFNHYYKLGHINKQNAYLTTCIMKCDVKRRRSRSLDSERRRTSTFEYNILAKGKVVQICKVAFCNIHGLSAAKVSHIQHKMAIDDVTPPKDLRGKHGTRTNRIPQDSIERIKDHISSFSVSFFKVPDSDKFEINFPHNMNLRKMYRLYTEICLEMDMPAERESRYRRIFKQMFNGDRTCGNISNNYSPNEELNHNNVSNSYMSEDKEQSLEYL